MKQRRRIYYSEAQRAEICDRWKHWNPLAHNRLRNRGTSKSNPQYAICIRPITASIFSLMPLAPGLVSALT